MMIKQIETKCIEREQELLNKYFGNLVKEASIEKPETIGSYTKDLPLKIEEEYFQYLNSLWGEVFPDKPIPQGGVFDKQDISRLMTEDDREGINYAYEDATRRTLWERITQSNHKDVTYYKGLLKEYTRELLTCLRYDFIEDVKKLVK